MKSIKSFGLALCLGLIVSCDRPLTHPQIDGIIQQYDNADFSAFKNAYVGYRGKDETANVMLMVAQFDLKCPPYIATFYPKTGELVKIDDHLLKEGGHKCAPYFSKAQITVLGKAFLAHDMKVIGADAGGNVYLNPNEQDAPNLLRRNPGSTPRDLKDFKLYKGHWYVRNED